MNEEMGVSACAPAADKRAYIYRANYFAGGALEIWNRKDKDWQWFFSSDNPPYASMTTAERSLNQFIDKGLIEMPGIKDVWEIGASRIDVMAKRWPARFI